LRLGRVVEIRIDPALRRKHMAHNHGYEYQIRIVHKDGIEELSGWMNNIEQVAQAMLAVPRIQGKTYWLVVRNVLCPGCSDREQIVEYPLVHVPSPRYLPHDSLSAGNRVEEPVRFGLFSIGACNIGLCAHTKPHF
jgi:hypothetical protein